MDRIDYALMEALQADARASLAELGKTIGLSISATNERIKKLVTSGTLRGWTVRLDARKLGYPVLAFVSVSIDRPENEPQFLDAIRAIVTESSGATIAVLLLVGWLILGIAASSIAIARRRTTSLAAVIAAG